MNDKENQVASKGQADRQNEPIRSSSSPLMDPRKLLYFAAVVEHGSLKRAAAHLGISQPALSTSMDRFEQSVGSHLLHRGPMGVTPTPRGEILYAHARLIREELDRAGTRLTEPADAEGSLTFGTLPSLATGIVPEAVCRWRRDNVTATLRVVEKNQIELVVGLLRGELDFIVAQTEVFGFEEGVRQRVLFRDRLYVLARPGHPALEIAHPTWSVLASFPWVVQMVGRQRMLLEKVLAAEAALLPHQLTESGSVNFIRTVVAGSDSLAVLPAATVSREVQEGRLMPVGIEDPLLDRDIAVLFREGANLRPASRDLLSHIEAVGLRQSQQSLHALAVR